MLFDPALPREAREGLSAALGAPSRMLAWARTSDGFLVATPGYLAWSHGEDWGSIGWHEIVHGGWDGETAMLRWQTEAGGSQEFVLEASGRLPEVFRERVGASIVLEEHRRGPGRVDLVITARRDLGNPHGALVWSAVPLDGRTLDRPGLAAFAEETIAAFRDDVEG